MNKRPEPPAGNAVPWPGAGETKNFRQRLALCSSHWIDARQ
jgi:hypothetical protein